ncbi:hypothetical protein [Heyndrickxia coagulans]|uniref:hypothetical protein n=1 Tax=Heyndrickxia coagulans TaxID=1398 RepID=UPI00036DBE4E|nr:hypothetical protein [Heyndrickxia coagulans]
MISMKNLILVRNKEGIKKMRPTTQLKRTVEWTIDNKKLKIINVPYEKLPVDGEIFYDADVSIRIMMLKDLMFADRIPPIVDYEIVKDFPV